MAPENPRDQESASKAAEPSATQSDGTPNADHHPEIQPSLAAQPAPVLEIAHVLFMDIVGYSKQLMERQTELLHKLQQQVRATAGYQRALAADQLISLPTGDGMALVFFRDPVAPVECAVELAKALRNHPDIHLRIGIHTGPVYHVADIKANRNVSGDGINLAQRVMDCGDAGHILISRSVAEILGNLSQWAPHLHDLGEQEVKHGVKIHIYNLYTNDAGNSELPRKMAAAAEAAGVKPERGSPSAATQPQSRLMLIGALLGAIIVGAWYLSNRKTPEQPAPVAATTPAERSFSYSIYVQRYRDGKPYKEPFVLPGEMNFEQDYHIRLQIESAQAGYLYILNQGPDSQSGSPSYNILYPGSGASAMVDSYEKVRIPDGDQDWIVFDAQEGTEQMWLVWSREASPVFESAKAFGDAKYQGAIGDSSLVEQIHQFLTKQESSPPETVRDEANQKTTVSGNGSVIVKLLKLEHH